MYLVLILRIRRPVSNSPSAGDLIGLIEPSIQHTKIQYPVDARFHPAGAAGLFAAAGCVQPKVDPLHHIPSNFNSIVLEENQALRKRRVARQLDYLANERFARMILWMRLAGDHNLD